MLGVGTTVDSTSLWVPDVVYVPEEASRLAVLALTRESR